MEKGNYLFTSESVSEGHPDKVADQISDAILDEFLARDPSSKVACETLVTTGQVVIAGEVKSDAYVDLAEVARRTISEIGYNRSELKFDAQACGIFSALHEQSGDINRGVEKTDVEQQGAGDQGMMFGYACDETPGYMPLALDLSHKILKELAEIRKEGKKMKYLRPDAKSQVTVEYSSDGRPLRIHTIVISTQHDEFLTPKPGHSQEETDERMLEKIKHDILNILLPRLLKKLPKEIKKMFDAELILHVNPTGKFVIGGPHGDTGLTGRKIVVDTYGGRGAHGGGAFSGKDPSKVDRSAAYAARHIAKNLVAAGVAKEALVQLAYAIGVAEPVSVYVNTRGTAKVALSDGEISEKVSKIFRLTPFAIEQRLKLRQPIYRETASYGHMGREPQIVEKEFTDGKETFRRTVELFTWEKLDTIDKIRKEFGIKN